MPAADAAALGAVAGLVPSFAHNQALGRAADSEAVVTARVVELKAERDRVRREAREGLEAAGVLPTAAQVHAMAEVEHAKAHSDRPDPPRDEWDGLFTYHVPERYSGGGEPLPAIPVDPALAEAAALEGNPAHRAILLAAKRSKLAAAERRMAMRAASRLRPEARRGEAAQSCCRDPGCECKDDVYAGRSAVSAQARPTLGPAVADSRALSVSPNW